MNGSMGTNNIFRCLLFVGLLLVSQPGCITFTNYAIPADRLPDCLKGASKGHRVPLNIALLGQPIPRFYTIESGDLLGIYAKGLMPTDTDEMAPLIPSQSNFSNVYYPPSGQQTSPSFGFPVEVNGNGQLPLPILGNIDVRGLTIEQAAEQIARACVEKKVVQAGREYVYISLLRSRVVRVMIVRDEAPSDIPQGLRKDAPLLSKRGHAQVVDLPAFENDILHALTVSGGLPGFDAYNEVWVLRRTNHNSIVHQQLWQANPDDPNLTAMINANECAVSARRIPLWINECDCGFCPSDVVLNEGDILYVKSRNDEYFYTGGLLPGGMVPMPRDQDLDIIDAISLANGSIGSPSGAGGLAIVRAGAGVGNVIPPSRATIVRKLPNEQQISIRVDLSKAIRDRKHRVLVQPGDLVTLHYKPGEILSNSLLNIVNLNYVIGSNN